MAEKEAIKVSLGTVVCIIFIVLLLAGCVALYYFGFVEKDKKISELENKITLIEAEIKNSEIEKENEETNKYDVIKNELEEDEFLFVTDVVKKDNQYTLKGVVYSLYMISESELEKIIEDGYMVINNKKFIVELNEETGVYELYEDDFAEYPLYKLIYITSNEYYLEGQVQFSTTWEPTNRYMEITLDGEIPCDQNGEYALDDKTLTVKEVFENYEHQDIQYVTHPSDLYTFSFEFENGKCIKVLDYFTSL